MDSVYVYIYIYVCVYLYDFIRRVMYNMYRNIICVLDGLGVWADMFHHVSVLRCGLGWDRRSFVVEILGSMIHSFMEHSFKSFRNDDLGHVGT